MSARAEKRMVVVSVREERGRRRQYEGRGEGRRRRRGKGGGIEALHYEREVGGGILEQ